MPLTVRVKAVPPAAAKLGLRLVMASPGGLIVKLTAPEAAPPEIRHGDTRGAGGRDQAGCDRCCQLRGADESGGEG